jgi:hypothetical protein
VGPGRHNHAWLAELGALQGSPTVLLIGWQLSAQDLKALSQLQRVKELQMSSSVQPLAALPLLGRMPALQRLELSVPSLVNAADDADQVAQAAALRSALVGLYMFVGWEGHLHLSNTDGCRAAAAQQALAAVPVDLAAADVAASISVKPPPRVWAPPLTARACQPGTSCAQPFGG